MLKFGPNKGVTAPKLRHLAEGLMQRTLANKALELIGKHLGMFVDPYPPEDKPVQITMVIIICLMTDLANIRLTE